MKRRRLKTAALKELIANKYFQKLEAGADWAIRAGLRQRFGWTFEGSQPPLPEVMGSFADSPEIKIVFHPGPGRPEFDITPPPKPAPPSPYEGQAPDLSKPALEPPRDHSIDPGVASDHCAWTRTATAG
jgi:hypothetical protein